MKKNLGKRILSLALALVLVLALLPHMATQAHAAVSGTFTADGITYTAELIKYVGESRIRHRP